jgi:hypothetical protein
MLAFRGESQLPTLNINGRNPSLCIRAETLKGGASPDRRSLRISEWRAALKVTDVTQFPIRETDV